MSFAERLVAFIAFVLLLPFLAALAVVIGLLSGQPPVVAHRRLGYKGVPFWMLKFRTMWRTGARAPHKHHGIVERLMDDRVPERKLGPDPRVTSIFAAFCRRHSIDELPQLALVASGRMSVVGPRPITRFELSEY